jgi:hypothetical protein
MLFGAASRRSLLAEAKRKLQRLNRMIELGKQSKRVANAIEWKIVAIKHKITERDSAARLPCHQQLARRLHGPAHGPDIKPVTTT